MEERPPPSPEKLLRQYRDWIDETEPPGRTMSYLKTGFLPEVLAEQESQNGVAAMLEAWERWERGETNPTAVLESLRDGGIDELLEGLVAD